MCGADHFESPIICRIYKNNVTISIYKFSAAKIYSSGLNEYFFCPPIMSCVSMTRYSPKTRAPRHAYTNRTTRPWKKMVRNPKHISTMRATKRHLEEE